MMDFYRPNEKRARRAMLLIYIVLAVKMIAVLSGGFQYLLIQTVLSGGGISEETVGLNDLVARVVFGVHLLVLLISAVTFIAWFRRAYYNLHQRAPFVRRAEGWAAGGWFVPIMSFYVPYQIMRELYESSKQLLDEKFINAVPNFTTRYLGLWWALWIGNGIIGQISFRLSDAASTLEGLRFSTLFNIFFMAVGIVSCFVTARVIRDYAAIQPMMQELEDPAPISDPHELQEAYNEWTARDKTAV